MGIFRNGVIMRIKRLEDEFSELLSVKNRKEDPANSEIKTVEKMTPRPDQLAMYELYVRKIIEKTEANEYIWSEVMPSTIPNIIHTVYSCDADGCSFLVYRELMKECFFLTTTFSNRVFRRSLNTIDYPHLQTALTHLYYHVRSTIPKFDDFISEFLRHD